MQVTAVVVVVEEEVAVEAAAEEEVMMMTRMTVHLPYDQVHPVAAERDVGFSTIKKWNSN